MAEEKDDRIEQRGGTKLGNGFSDKLTALKSLDLSKVKNTNDLVTQMNLTSFGGRSVGEAADVLHAMVKDKECFKVLTLAGAMTMAKMGLVICEMIDNDMIDCIISTGALMAHGFIEAAGLTHFKYDSRMSDEDLYKKGYNRVYDTIELEKNLDDAEEIINKILDKWPRDKIMSSWELNRKLGEHLEKHTTGSGVLKSAFKKNIPVFIPAFTDSEFGLDIGLYNRKLVIKGEQKLRFDPFIDLEKYTEMVTKAKKIGIFTIGGGVPRNWAQQVGPYLDCIRFRIREKGDMSKYWADSTPDKIDPLFKRFHYAVRICPEPVHWGGLSGCTYSEGVSWGKFLSKKEGGMQAEVYCDATIAWPLIVKAVLERMEKEK